MLLPLEHNQHEFVKFDIKGRSRFVCVEDLTFLYGHKPQLSGQL